jgi:CubicO group peptidase (beta-lactamase class C family)
LRNPPTPPTAPNRREWRAAEIPSANGHGNARSLARVMAALSMGGELEGVWLMSRATLERTIEEQAYGPDLVLGETMRWGLGYLIYGAERGWNLPNQRLFGHSGWGGSLAIADPDARLSWAYVMNRMLPGTTGDERSVKLAQALYRSLGYGV